MIGKLISKICPIFMVPESNPVNEEKYIEIEKILLLFMKKKKIDIFIP